MRTVHWEQWWNRPITLFQTAVYAPSFQHATYLGVKNTAMMVDIRKNNGDFWLDRDERARTERHARTISLHDAIYLRTMNAAALRTMEASLVQLKRVAHTIETKRSNDAFASLSRRMTRLAERVIAPMWVHIRIEQEVEARLREIVPEEKDFHTVIELQRPLHTQQEEYELARIRRMRIGRDAALRRHAACYSYIPCYDPAIAPWSLADFQQRLNHLTTIEAGQRVTHFEQRFERAHTNFLALLRRPWSASEKQYLRFASDFIFMKDYRSHYRSMQAFLMRSLFSVIAVRSGLTIEDLVFLVPQEIEALLRAGKLPQDHAHRKNHVLYVRVGSTEQVLTDPAATKFMTRLSHAHAKTTELHGTIAEQGTARGIARIIRTPQDTVKVRHGDILIATMTRPDYLAAMQRAAAFVTDEGGMLCHAAIVAREMQKPCIVGTKNATKVFKDGDRVEVDATKGIVKKL